MAWQNPFIMLVSSSGNATSGIDNVISSRDDLLI
uniref:Uncharacterized protein n=1 Tax=Arundo donax TaxID=35708 RepID=A0A0A9FF61_ARUDO